MYWLNVFALLDSLRVLHCPVLDRFFVVNEFEWSRNVPHTMAVLV